MVLSLTFYFCSTEPRRVGLDGSSLLPDKQNRGSPGLLRENSGLHYRSLRHARHLSETGFDLLGKGRSAFFVFHLIVFVNYISMACDTKLGLENCVRHRNLESTVISFISKE